MAENLLASLQSLGLTPEQIREQNPRWSDEMILDRISLMEDIELIATELSKVVNPFGLLDKSVASSGDIKFRKMPVNAKPPQLVSKNTNINRPLFFHKKSNGASLNRYADAFLNTLALNINSTIKTKITGYTLQSQSIDLVNDELVVNDGGIYGLNFSCSFDADYPVPITFEIYIDGSPSGVDVFDTPQGVANLVQDLTTIQINKFIALSAGQTISVFVYHDSLFSLSLDIRNITLSIGG